MTFRPLSFPLSASALFVLVGAFGCSSSGGGQTANGGATGNGGSGTATGGQAAKGGNASTNGGSSTSTNGGSSTSNNGGSSSGGASSGGGSNSNGGASAQGGQGGASAGGKSAGGASNAGGSPGAGGGSSSGGKSSGGSSAGGASSSGGSSSGGAAPSGGTSSGGMAAGGAASGGAAAVKVCTVGSTLKESAACNNKLIGTALASGSLSNGSYSNAAKEFNFATPENEMKWDTIEASQGNFNFSPGNTIVNFAKQNNMKIKGHTLVWHSQLPSWVSSLGSADAVRSAMTNHIQKVMGQWKGSIYAWDVVNEAWETPDKKGNGTATLGDSVFHAKLGDGFIDEAFKIAKAADSNALLFYNDYSTEGMNDKSNAVYNMVKKMKENGVPIDGVGMQMHIGKPNDTPTAAEVKQNIDRLAALGLQVVISEMDVNGCDGINSSAMATIYHDIVAACVSQPLCTAITVWGISDSGSWLNSFSEAGCNGQSANALLFDGSYGKKATYNSVMQALVGK